MTPRELERAMSVLGVARTEAPAKQKLVELMNMFPDLLENHIG